ncbi:MAG TPA: hypothetical protein VJU87_06340 [Gemmatimonadaceae bacterium]|nr:hypothetical protein [Gemmatimonadaceae bacterium]
MHAPSGWLHQVKRVGLAAAAIVALGGLGACMAIPQRALQNGAQLTRITGRADAGVIGNNSFQAQRLRASFLQASAFDRAVPRPYAPCLGICGW